MRSKLKWGDFAIIGFVLLIAVALFAWFALRTGGNQLYAEVWRDNVMVDRVLLTEHTQQTIDLDGENIIVLNGRSAQMTEATCRDQVCVRTGKLTKAGQVAVCLPHRVVLKLVGEAAEIDAIAS